jgi:hypothetical protein
MVLIAFALAALATPPPLKFEILNKPGRVSYLKFALEVRLKNFGHKTFKVVSGLSAGTGYSWQAHDFKGNAVYPEKYEVEYVALGPDELTKLEPGRNLTGSEPWHYTMKDFPVKQRGIFQVSYCPNLMYDAISDPDVPQGPIASNKIVLELGPGYVDVLQNDLYKPKVRANAGEKP